MVNDCMAAMKLYRLYEKWVEAGRPKRERQKDGKPAVGRGQD